MSDCKHTWIMYTDLTATCTECDESRNGDELLAELQETIEELERDNSQLEQMLRDSLGERHKLECSIYTLEATTGEGDA